MNDKEYIYVDEHSISSSLICPICLEILEDPHTHIQCDSAFCRRCLSQLAEPICPICRCYWDDMYLPKANRLIRNMLDELLVECRQCHTIRRRGQFEHQCQSNQNFLSVKTKTWENFQIIFSALIIFVFILFIYNYRNIVFEPAVNRQHELIHGIGIDIDQYLFDKIYYLITKGIEYSIPIFIFNVFLWLNLLFYGDRYTSKTNSRILKEFIENLIIMNLIIYSICY